MPQQEAGSRSDKLLSDQMVYITCRILILRRTSPKRCSKSYIALFLSNTHLRRFYSLVNHSYYSRQSFINPQFFHKILGPPCHYTASLYSFSLPHITITMSGRRQILPPLPHVEDEMEQDTTEYQVERFRVQSPWQPTQLPGLPEHRDPPATTTSTSTDSNPNTVIGSTSIQFRPPVGTYKGKSPQRTQTTTPSITTSIQRQLTQLQAGKETALAQVKRLQTQQSSSTSFLQCTAADV